MGYKTITEDNIDILVVGTVGGALPCGLGVFVRNRTPRERARRAGSSGAGQSGHEIVGSARHVAGKTGTANSVDGKYARTD